MRPAAPAWIVAVLGLCAVLYFLELGDTAFLGKDEPKNAQAAREMLASGDWVVTTLGGEPWFDKPILYYWTALAGYALFGVGELGARLGPALAALAAVWLTYVLGVRVLGSRRGGALAALVLGTGPIFFYYARTAVTDALLTAAVTGALVAYFLVREGVRPARSAYLFWVAAALAVLAKGPVGLVLPGLVIAGDVAWSRPPGVLRRLRIATGLLVFAAVAGPWYVLVTARSGGRFLDDFLVYRNLVRFTSETLPHPGPFWYYLPVLLLAPYPWSLFLPGALTRIARSFRALPEVERDRLRFLIVWVALPTVFFSFAGSKLPSYLLPAFPAVAILLARELGLLAGERGRSATLALGAGAGAVAVVSLGAAAGAGWYVHQEMPGELPAAAPLLVVLALGGLSVAAVAALRRRWIVPALGATAFAVGVAVVLVMPGLLEGRSSARAIARRAMALGPGPGQLLSYRFHDNSFYFYTDARTERYDDLAWIEQRLVEAGGRGWCFVRSRDLPEVLGYPGLEATDLGAVRRIHLVELRLVDRFTLASPGLSLRLHPG